jgi:hypothetical protein
LIFAAGAGHAFRFEWLVHVGLDNLSLCEVHFAYLPAAWPASPGTKQRLKAKSIGLVRLGACRGTTALAVLDRRALLQRTRRSPIRPRRSRLDASARTVSTAKAAERLCLARLEIMIPLLQEPMARCKRCSVSDDGRFVLCGRQSIFADFSWPPLPPQPLPLCAA